MRPDAFAEEHTDASGKFFTRLRRYQDVLRRLKPDLLVTTTGGAIEWALAGRRLGLPQLHAEDGFGPEESDTQLLRRVLFRRLVLSRVRGIIVPSHSLQDLVRKRWGLGFRPVVFIPNGVKLPPDPARQAIDRAALGLPADRPLIAWVGVMRPEKNLGRLLRAFSRVPASAMLVLIGDGRERPEVERQIQELGLDGRVRLLGFRDDAAAILSLFDLFILSSDTEQMPMVVLEAMAAGLPIVSCDVGDVRMNVAEENRPYIVERSDDALARAMNSLLSEPALRRQIGAANRTRVADDFTAEKMIERYISVYQSAIENRVR